MSMVWYFLASAASRASTSSGLATSQRSGVLSTQVFFVRSLNAAWDGFGDMHGPPFLHLKPAGEHVDDARDLAQPDHFAVGNVREMDLAEERQHMMLAQAEDLYVFGDDHLVIVHFKESALQNLVGIDVGAAGEIFEGLLHALGGFDQSVACRIFAEPHEHFTQQFFRRSRGQSELFFVLQFLHDFKSWVLIPGRRRIRTN